MLFESPLPATSECASSSTSGSTSSPTARVPGYRSTSLIEIAATPTPTSRKAALPDRKAVSSVGSFGRSSSAITSPPRPVTRPNERTVSRSSFPHPRSAARSVRKRAAQQE